MYHVVHSPHPLFLALVRYAARRRGGEPGAVELALMAAEARLAVERLGPGLVRFLQAAERLNEAPPGSRRYRRAWQRLQRLAEAWSPPQPPKRSRGKSGRRIRR